MSGESVIEEEEKEQPRSEFKIPVKLVDLSEMSEEEQKKRFFKVVSSQLTLMRYFELSRLYS